LQTRGQQVEKLLDQAWAKGLRSYDELKQYVKKKTGKACSSKTIIAWKRTREAA
jgi:hypothetical protein